ncbi:MAG: hypothetical protein ACYDBH_01580 [Acidobacteriaceae bacterium]
MADPQSFAALLTAAVQDIVQHGFSSSERVAEWMARLRFAMLREFPSARDLEGRMAQALEGAFTHAVSPAVLARMNPGIPRFTIERIKPELRGELSRRVMASAELIKLNRETAIEGTLRRFSGWASSVPAGGSRVVDRNEVKAHIAKPIRGMTFEVRRMQTDQGHKLVASVNAVIAQQSGAIAAEWRSHGRHDKAYDARPEHLARDGKMYAIRGNWAIEQGLMRKGIGYTDEITQPAEEVSCRCWWSYRNHLRDLPDSMLTARGRLALRAPQTQAA